MVEDRDAFTHADLSHHPTKKGWKYYSFYGAIMVRASRKQVMRVLGRYDQLSEVIPYINTSRFDPKSRTLRLEGQLFKYKLWSNVLFEEEADHYLRYRFLRGHFSGMKGFLQIDPAPGKWAEQYVILMLTGEVIGQKWPPAFVVEKGMEIALSVTARKMRSYIEKHKNDRLMPKPQVP